MMRATLLPARIQEGGERPQPPAVASAAGGVPPAEVARALLSEVRESLTLPLTEARAGFERRMIAAYLARSGGSVARAAGLAGVKRESLYRAMRRLGMRERAQ